MQCGVNEIMQSFQLRFRCPTHRDTSSQLITHQEALVVVLSNIKGILFLKSCHPVIFIVKVTKNLILFSLASIESRVLL